MRFDYFLVPDLYIHIEYNIGVNLEERYDLIILNGIRTYNYISFFPNTSELTFTLWNQANSTIATFIDKYYSTDKYLVLSELMVFFLKNKINVNYKVCSTIVETINLKRKVLLNEI
jgi:hypothetical protein